MCVCGNILRQAQERKGIFMKKLLKGIMGVASITVVAAGVYYLAKKWLDEKDEELEDDLDDFETEDDSREYVTLDIEDDEEDDSVSEEDIAETESAADFENVAMTDASVLPEEDKDPEPTEAVENTAE